MLLVNTPQIIVESKRNLREERSTFEGRKVRLSLKKKQPSHFSRDICMRDIFPHAAFFFSCSCVKVLFSAVVECRIFVRESFVFRSRRVQDFRA